MFYRRYVIIDTIFSSGWSHFPDQFFEMALFQRLLHAENLVTDFLAVLFPKFEVESLLLALWLSPVTKTTWLSETLLLEVEFCLEKEVVCLPLKKVVFLLRPAERLANKATDRLPSRDVKDEAGALAGWAGPIESVLFCRLNKLLPRLLLSVWIDPRFLDVAMK